jgi:hypothetical protein
MSKRANGQLGGRERDRSWGEGHPTDAVKGMDMATGIDAFGIVWPARIDGAEAMWFYGILYDIHI